ncbi:hypothetical protein GCM10010446_11190 [Streptomyces enissocaesilis]|uniref:Uncharacterized protein n=1 Tax=Streptomyces enissocaesilis TaxID=332589 RepID=A0ABP6JC56_9ACTN
MTVLAAVEPEGDATGTAGRASWTPVTASSSAARATLGMLRRGRRKGLRALGGIGTALSVCGGTAYGRVAPRTALVIALTVEQK